MQNAQHPSIRDFTEAGYQSTVRGPYTMLSKRVGNRAYHVTAVNGQIWPKAKTMTGWGDVTTIPAIDALTVAQ